MPEAMRIDKLLWFLRLAASRSLAQEWAVTGHMRLNGRRVERASTVVRSGDRLVLPLRGTVRVIELVAIPQRRGPATEAQGSYRMIDSPGQASGPGAPDSGSGLTGGP